MHVVEIFRFLDNSTFLWLKTDEVQQALGNSCFYYVPQWSSPADIYTLVWSPPILNQKWLVWPMEHSEHDTSITSEARS